jgi:PKD repeat protein
MMPPRSEPAVPFLDLSRHHEPLREQFRLAFERVLDRNAFVLGEEVERFEHAFAHLCGTDHCVGVASGTAALTIMLKAAGIGPGDEVIVPAHTFIATALAVKHAGGTPVCIDVEEGSALLDPNAVEAAITPRTAAILAVHLYGQVCAMDPLRAIARRHGLGLFEDAAQAHGARYRDRVAGGLGDGAAFSFYPSKNRGMLGMRRTLAMLAWALAALAAAAPVAQALAVRGERGHLLSVYAPSSPPAQVEPALRALPRASTQELRYHGGLVLHSSAPQLVFWDPAGAIPLPWEALMVRYFADVARDSATSSNAGDVLRQYADATGFANRMQVFDPRAQTILDRQPYPTSDGCTTLPAGLATCLTDDQVEQELTRLVAAGRPAGDGHVAPIYFVILPPTTNVCVEQGECASNYLCGYHSYAQQGDTTILYAVIPSTSLLSGQDPKTCQTDGNNTLQTPNRSQADQLLSTASHEDAEVITDPLMDAWYATSQIVEVADMCSNTGPADPLAGTSPEAFDPVLGGSAGSGDLFNQLIAGDRFYLQGNWSDGVAGCALRPPAATIRAGFTATSTGATSVSLTPELPSGKAYSSVTWDFGDGSTPTFKRGATAGQPVPHTYAQRGQYSVTETVVDAGGTMATATEPIAVGTAPAGQPLALLPGARGSTAPTSPRSSTPGKHRHHARRRSHKRHRHSRRQRR